MSRGPAPPYLFRFTLTEHSGLTRRETNISEARSYHNLAVANSYFNLLPKDNIPSDRILLEERALDSYYNILFSLILFWRRHAVWPTRLTIVSHAFKRNRLVDGHCTAIGFPADRVNFVGINPPGIGAAGLEGEDPGEKAEAMRGVQLAIGQWAEDPHGVGEALSEKRRMRNCWGVQQQLFWDEEERARSGVDVRTLEGGIEALVDGGRRPWARGWDFQGHKD